MTNFKFQTILEDEKDLKLLNINIINYEVFRVVPRSVPRFSAIKTSLTLNRAERNAESRKNTHR